MPSFADAIAGIESAGQQDPYAAVGPATRTGDRAYGRYQVMGTNVGPWTAEVFGKPMSVEEFVANPQAQDAVFNTKFGQSVARYGNPQDAASVWFTGKPLAEGAGRADVNGMTGQRYVDQFTQNLGGGSPAGIPFQPNSTAALPQQSTGSSTGTLANVFQQAASPAYAQPRSQPLVNPVPPGEPFDPEQERAFSPRTTQRNRAGRR